MAEEINISAIYRPRKAYETEPFDSSAVDFTKFAEMVTRILSIFDQGLVIAIDGPWGHGKSFFGTNFAAQLKKSGWQTAYVDAFAHDYIEDPFLLIASTIITDIAAPKHKGNLLKAASGVGKALLPIAAKAAVRIGTFAAIDAEDIEDVKKAITDAGGEAAERLVTKRLQDFERERAGIENFRKRLTELAETVKQDSGHPLVVFLDELDRCQLTFAIRALERIKHFFDVPHLSFVLLLNRKQLEAAVNGLYGSTVDAETYLRKFIQFDIQLPQHQRAHGNAKSHVANFVDFLGEKVSLGDQSAFLRPFIGAMRELAPQFGLSMRDVEKAFTLFITACIGRNFAVQLVDLLAFIIVLRVAAPGVYQGVVQRTDEGYAGARNLVKIAEQKGMREHLARLCLDIVLAHIKGADKLGQDSPLRRSVAMLNLEPEHTFAFFSEMLDQVIIR